MIVTVDPAAAVPPYEQIRAQIATMVATGVLAAGARLPTIRQLAGDLGVATGTVARAYRELESGGIVESRGRHGTFVTEGRRRVDARTARARLAAAARAYAVTARQLGVPDDTAITAAAKALRSGG